MPFSFLPKILSQGESYFAAMNTPKGFLSEFPSLFSPYRRFIIKGGPGTGKSTLMKKLAKTAEERKMASIRYYCSSDTDSLDAVVIPALSLALLDGTAPHAEEPLLVGARDLYLDLAQFADPKALVGHTEELMRLHQEKQRAYQSAYRRLFAFHTVEEDLNDARKQLFLSDKCRLTLCRLIDRLHLTHSSSRSARHIPIAAFGIHGYLALDTYAQKAKTHVYIRDRHRVAPLVFALLQKELTLRGIGYTFSRCPMTLATDTVYLQDDRILFTSLPLSQNADILVNCERFLKDRGSRLCREQKPLLSTAEQLLKAAEHAITQAGKAHAEAEIYYRAAMDFDALDRFTDRLLSEIFA
ncbi:MAG: hypothetical protein IJW46_04240 [Clostridia bacterium]|nr:hypothetical protein [Clostridia bacterium]